MAADSLTEREPWEAFRAGMRVRCIGWADVFEVVAVRPPTNITIRNVTNPECIGTSTVHPDRLRPAEPTEVDRGGE